MAEIKFFRYKPITAGKPEAAGGCPCLIPIDKMTLITTDDRVFELRSGESLLEGLERTGHEVEYQCRSGYCGACRVKLRAGRVDYDELPLAFVGPNEVLPCCCRVSGPIEIDCRARVQERDLFDSDLFENQ